MILLWFIIIFMAGGLIAWIAERWSTTLPRWIALSSTVINFLLSIGLWIQSSNDLSEKSSWIQTLSVPWISSFGVTFNLALDGLSMLLILLTFFLAMLAVLTSWKEIQFRAGFYYFNLLWVLAGITGVFIALDLFLFYFFWEVMLIPMYFLIGIWGHENKTYAAFKFFIFTQASGLLMFLAILGLYFVHGNNTGIFTFNYFELLGTEMSPEIARLLMSGFLIAFIVKLPVVPFHTWLPDAHSQAPTAGSLILAGLLLKTGAYGLMRFVVPLFPGASIDIAPWAMLLGVGGILYGAVLAFSQTDFKRLVAYTSVSHMGFVMLGIFAFNKLAWQGVVMQIITHGISTGALFILAGTVYERIHTRDLLKMGGFWTKMPFMATVALIFSMASLGLPGLGNFIAEFLILIGSWQANPVLTVFAAIGIVGATAYSLRIMQKIFYGVENTNQVLADTTPREKLIFLPMIVAILWLGIFPQSFLETTRHTVTKALENFTVSIDLPQKDLTKKHTTHAKGGLYE